MFWLQISVILFIIWNVYVFAAMGRDKRLAKRGQWRIPEARLLLMGFVFGGIGLYLGMTFFHHKTLHKKFTLGVPILIVVNLLELGLIYYVSKS